MTMTFFFVWLSNFINIKVFDSNFLKKRGHFIRFLISSVMAETYISAISIPMMFYKNGLSDHLLSSILVVSSYKVLASLIIYIIISIRIKMSSHHQEECLVPL